MPVRFPWISSVVLACLATACARELPGTLLDFEGHAGPEINSRSSDFALTGEGFLLAAQSTGAHTGIDVFRLNPDGLSPMPALLQPGEGVGSFPADLKFIAEPDGAVSVLWSKTSVNADSTEGTFHAARLLADGWERTAAPVFPVEDGFPRVSAVAVLPGGDVVASVGVQPVMGPMTSAIFRRLAGASEWTELTQGTRPSGFDLSSIAAAPDGQLYRSDVRQPILRWSGELWVVHAPLPDEAFAHFRFLIAQDAGTLIVGGTRFDSGSDLPYVLRWDGSAWAELPEIPGRRHSTLVALSTAPDGSLWAAVSEVDAGRMSPFDVVRFAGSQWEPIAEDIGLDLFSGSIEVVRFGFREQEIFVQWDEGIADWRIAGPYRVKPHVLRLNP